MIKALLSVRFRALFAGMTAQAKKKNKKSVGMVIVFALLYLYVGAVLCGAMGILFYSLAEPYHMLSLDWLYFSTAGTMALGFSIFGSVFTTQGQLYDAKDNATLLSMPIPPRLILISRIIPLLALNLLFGGMVMVPAMVVYAIFVEFSVFGLLLQLLGLVAICFLAQAIACLLGWLLHLLLSRMNKSFASLLYMVVFLGVYFTVYPQAGDILNAMATQGQQIASAMQTWVWPLYALGRGCADTWYMILPVVAIAAVCFTAVWLLLSAPFLRSATTQRGSRTAKLDLHTTRASSPVRAIVTKELRKFLGCPVYLTNMGLGVILTAALGVAGILFRPKVVEFLELVPMLMPYTGDPAEGQMRWRRLLHFHRLHLYPLRISGGQEPLDPQIHAGKGNHHSGCEAAAALRSQHARGGGIRPAPFPHLRLQPAGYPAMHPDSHASVRPQRRNRPADGA